MPRKQHSHHFIYKTVCLITNKFYYGMHSTNDLEDGYLGSGKRLRYSINKHGEQNHKIEILEYLDSRELLKEREKELITEDMLKDPMCMNLQLGGGGGFTREQCLKGTLQMNKVLWSNEEFVKSHKERKSKMMTNLWNFGKIKRCDWTGKKHSEATKEKMKATHKERGHQKGEKNSGYGMCWIYNIDDKLNKKIKKEFLKEHLDNGWIKGRKMKF